MNIFYEEKYISLRRWLFLTVVMALMVTMWPIGPSSAEANSQNSKVIEPKELVKDRTDDSKVMDNGNGTFTKEIYFEPIHNKVGSKWEEISTDIIQSGSVLKPKNTFIDVKFDPNMKGGKYATVQSGQDSLEYTFLGAQGDPSDKNKDEVKKNHAPAEAEKKEGQGAEGKETRAGPKEVEAKVEKNKVTYPHVLPSVHLRNEVFNSKVKEDIVLDRYSGLHTFKFQINSNLNSKKSEDGKILFTNKEGKEVFVLSKPYMYDSNVDPQSDEPAQSDKVEYVINKVDGKTILSIQADDAWLKDSARKYPVYIDPSTNIDTAGDTYVTNRYPTTNYGSDKELKVGYYDDNTGTNYAYLKQDVNNLKGMVIDSASLNVHVAHAYYNAPKANGLWLDAVSGDWSESGLTWKVQESKEITSRNIGMQKVARGQKVSFDVKSTVQEWATGIAANHGFKFHINGNGKEFWKKISSSESANKPYLSVTYHPRKIKTPTGVAYSNWVGSDNGFVDLRWEPIPNATKYFVWIFNGKDYQKYDVGNSTYWSTHNKGIWPTESEIKEGRYELHTDGKGTELALDPSPVYKNSGGTYQDKKNYWFRISAVVENSETPESEPFMPTISPRADDLGTEEYWTFGEIPGGDVNAVTGNMILSETDLELSGREPAMSIDRTYNSRSKEAGPFGKGWTFNYATRLEEDKKGNVLQHDMDGGIHYYQKKSDGVYTSPLGVHLTLKGTKEAGWTLTDKDQTIYHFNSAGQLIEIEDANKNKLILTYNDQKQLTTITDPSKRTFSLTYTKDRITKITGPDNRAWTYKYNYETDRLIEITDETNTTTKYGYYTKGDQLGSIIEADGRETWYEYSDQNQLVEVIDPEDTLTTIKYVSDEKKTTVMNADGNVTDHYYNDSGNPVKEVEDPKGLNRVTTYTFDHNNLIKKCDPEASKNGCTKPTESYQYDSNGNMTKAEDATGSETFKYNQNNDLVEYKDADGNSYKYVHDEKGNEISEIDPDKVSSAQTVDEKGNIIAATDAMGVGENLIINPDLERTTSDMASDWKVEKVRADGSATVDSTVKYSGNQSIKVTTKAVNADLGYVGAIQDLYVAPNTTYTISAMIKSQDLKEAGAFLNVQQSKSTGDVVTWVDNRYSQVSGTQGWTRRQLTFKTGADSEKIRIYLEVDHRNPKGSGTAWFDQVQLEEGDVSTDYNPIENSSFEEGKGFWNEAVGSGTIDNTQSFDGSQSIKMTRGDTTAGAVQYLQTISLNQSTAKHITVTGLSKAMGVVNNIDKAPNKDYSLYIDAVQDEGDGKTSLKTDQAKFALGTHDWQRSAVTIKPDKPLKAVHVYVLFRGNNTGTAWFDNIRLKEGSTIEKYAYDASGNYVTQVTDPVGNSSSVQHDEYGNEKSITDAKKNKTDYTYDDSNQLKTITLPGDKLKVHFTHDENGNVVEKKATSADGKTVHNQVRYTYKDDQLVAYTDELGNTTEYEHDGEGDVTTITQPNGKKVETIASEDGSYVGTHYDGTERYRTYYDTNGNETKIENLKLKQAKQLQFDAAERLTEIKQGEGTQSWTYNTNDELTSSKFTHGKDQATVNYTYNESEQNTEVKDDTDKTYRFDYDEKGNVRTAVYANKVGTYATYDDNNRVTEVSVGKGDGTPLAKYSYEYDGNGNATKIKDLVQNKELKFTYDEWDQLTSETDPVTNHIISYTYDSLGNRTKKEVKDTDGKVISITPYTYNKGNQLVKVGDSAYSYDKNGNRLEDGKFHYTWDAGDNLTEIKEKSSDKVIATYEYDEDDRRIRSTVNGKVTNFFYDGESINILYETDGNNQLTRHYTYGEGGQRLSMTKATGETYYYHYNDHGDVVSITDDKQNEVANYIYDAWGNIVEKKGELADENPYRYAGYRYDNETGLYYLIARYYQPEEGVFLSVDPDPGDEDDPQTQNVYVYVTNNPLKFIDPDGHMGGLGRLLGRTGGKGGNKGTGGKGTGSKNGNNKSTNSNKKKKPSDKDVAAGLAGLRSKIGSLMDDVSKSVRSAYSKISKKSKGKSNKPSNKKKDKSKKQKQSRYHKGKKSKKTKKHTVNRKSSSNKSKYSSNRSKGSKKRVESGGNRKVKKGQKTTVNKYKITAKAPQKSLSARKQAMEKYAQDLKRCLKDELNLQSRVKRSVNEGSTSDDKTCKIIKATFENVLSNALPEDMEFLRDKVKPGMDDDLFKKLTQTGVNGRLDLPNQFRTKGNIAFAKVDLEGLNTSEDFLRAFGASKLKDTIFTGADWVNEKHFSSVQRNFKTLWVDGNSKIDGDGSWDRSTDSEAILFEHLDKKISEAKAKNPNLDVKGKMDLFTERKPCVSCSNVLTQFLKKHKGIEVTIYSNESHLGLTSMDVIRKDEMEKEKERRKKGN
ncbi:RHS repeat-associated core domain-containing protein [Thermoactinomyces sp. DSM 45891]|uniref:DNRLRE domain-containing protein n=1 Tax=Thermoactinomyces sp. DSM 45891 TaxID=1761907 RepID=UPI000916D573|nr:DNRLRE domain-containing protein [Thermoactinomyces sp. DSM 45891]SFX65338.1 RHS repeat-associated core domain-containing protein [Thermoactinomyces sp. DSM 45891]